MQRARSEDLPALKVDVADYPPQKGKAALDPNHNFQILVDHGSDEYGGEMKFRAAFERRLCATQTGHAPVVMVVVQGGPNTIL